MAQHERTTFTRCDEVIEHGILHLRRIDDAVEALAQRDHPERVRMLLRSVAVEQRNLLGALERFLDDLPANVADTYEQYTVELPATVEPPDDDPLTTLGLVRWLERQNRPLHATFAELAGKESGELAEVLGGIAAQVEAHDRRLSTEYQRLEDL